MNGDASRSAPLLPDWAHGMTDVHVHGSPSLLPRHARDAEIAAEETDLGFSTVVLKAHEGSTADRAALAADRLPESAILGGVVLNSPVGGANPDAVACAAGLGARVVWMPTVSAKAHRAAASSPELSVHRTVSFSAVDVIADGVLLPAWQHVLETVAAHDLVLASGHLAASETVALFREARARGVRRLLVNHPKLAFLGWSEAAGEELRTLDAHLELGILPDLVGGREHTSLDLVGAYPSELLVFGGDLGHAHYPRPTQALPPWLAELEARAGSSTARAIMTTNGRELVLP